MDDTRKRIITATYRAVRLYGLNGVRIQNISDLAGLTSGALYRHFSSKDDLMIAAFTYADRQAAAIFDRMSFDFRKVQTDPLEAIRQLWFPYFRFWIAHPDETVFYHCFRDSSIFPEYDRRRDAGYFHSFVIMVKAFQNTYPELASTNQDLLWLHILTGTVMYAKYVVEGTLPNNEETEREIFRLLVFGLSGFFPPNTLEQGGGPSPA